MVTSDTHTITVVVAYRYPHGAVPSGSQSVTVTGDGDIEHFLTTFQAALVASGFATDTAQKLVILKD